MGFGSDEIRVNIERIRERAAAAAVFAGRKPEEITLVAVTKNHGADAVRAALQCGVGAFGENRVQEYLEKAQLGAYGDIPVHLIGTLQKNKAGKIVGKVGLIQSVDSAELALCISKKAAQLGIVQDILIEVNIGAEASKGGAEPGFAGELAAMISQMPGIRLMGLMAIPPKADPNEGNLKYFNEMYKLFVDIRSKKYDNGCMGILSMGMSDDFEAAIAGGSNMIRVGSAIFGPRSL